MHYLYCTFHVFENIIPLADHLGLTLYNSIVIVFHIKSSLIKVNYNIVN